MSFYQLLLLFALETAASGKKMPLGINDFSEIITQDFLFVDKTEFIKDVMNDETQVILITRPRLFGKSIGLSMLHYFFENRISNPHTSNTDIFNGLKISEDKKFCAAHRNQYPVIHLSFKDLVATDYKAAETKIFEIVGQVYEHHAYLLAKNVLNASETQKFEMIKNKNGSLEDVQMSIVSLCRYLNEHTKKRAIVLIDEFEKAFQTAYFNRYFEQMSFLITGILLPCLKDNKYLLKGVMTGISVIGHDTVIAQLGNVKIYSVLKDDKYAKYFGFTPEDISYVLAKTGLIAKRDKLEEWYTGYTFSGLSIYNPFSIIAFLRENGVPGFYWVKTAGTEFIIKVVSAMGPDVQATFQNLLKNGTVDREIYNEISYETLVQEEDALWTLLVHTAYIRAVPKDVEKSLFTLSIPNKEIRDELISLNKTVMGGLDRNFRPKP